MNKKLVPGLALTTVALASLLTSCGESTGAASGDRVEDQASPAAFAAGLADAEEVTLVAQSVDPPGKRLSLPLEEYAAAVEEWSDGKVRMEITYSQAIAEPTEVDDALADGRLDLALLFPSYEPDRYPASDLLTQLTFLADQSPVNGFMSGTAAMLDAASSSDEVGSELESAGVHPLVPYLYSNNTGLACTEKRVDADSAGGATTRAGSETVVAQLSALGMQPVSLPFTELYEALERGTVDCVATGLTTAQIAGVLDSAKHWVIDSDAALASAGAALGISKARWDDLPLAAQQLLHAKLDVFLASYLRTVLGSTAEAAKQVHDAGGEIVAYADDARALVAGTNEDLLANARKSDSVEDADSLVDGLQSSLELWDQHAATAGEDVTYDKFATTDLDLVDVEGFVAQVVAEALAQRAP